MTAIITDTAATLTAPAPEPMATAAHAYDVQAAISVFSSEDTYKSSLRMANALCQSSLVPKPYQGKDNIPNVLIAMELASRIGASVLMVMQSLDVIHGRPSWRAQFLIATVNSCRRFTPLRFRWFGTEGQQDWGCRAYAKDRENGEECVGTKITMQMAFAEGWSTKPGSKWLTMSEQMLMYRAAAFWTRIFAPELSLGMQTKEEIVDTYGYEVVPRAASTSTTDTKSLEAALLAAPVPKPTENVKPSHDADGVITSPQEGRPGHIGVYAPYVPNPVHSEAALEQTIANQEATADESHLGPLPMPPWLTNPADAQQCSPPTTKATPAAKKRVREPGEEG